MILFEFTDYFRHHNNEDFPIQSTYFDPLETLSFLVYKWTIQTNMRQWDNSIEKCARNNLIPSLSLATACFISISNVDGPLK